MGVTTDAKTGRALPGVNVLVQGTQQGASSGPDGRFLIGPLDAGVHQVEARFVGYQHAASAVRVSPGDTTRVRFALPARAIGLEAVEVTARRESPATQEQLRRAEIQEANPRDGGELLRLMPGTDAVRRGPVGLDPVVRGLREEQIGVYVDGVRSMPAGPARMDSPLSHSGPSTMRSVEVVKGPYALTWGAGNMSAIRVETGGLWSGPPVHLRGQVQTGYDTNVGSYETTAAASGESGPWAYRFDGGYRRGHSYESGAGARVPADFTNQELRGGLGYQFSAEPGSAARHRVEASGGYQRQDDVDYPGRLLNAVYFENGRSRLRYEYVSGEGLLRSVEALGYGYQTLHTMNNRGKVTYDSEDFPGPPLRVTVDAEIQTVGGRVAAELVPSSELRFTVGTDAYRAYRNAERPFQVVMNGEPSPPPFEYSDQIWPGVSIADVGFFAQATRLFGPVEASGTVRTDFVWAGADEEQVSGLYLDIAEPGEGRLALEELDQRETNVSGALMLSAELSSAWALSIGGGTAVRTAGALERYADRFPANKAQTSAEFIGDPRLNPERSWQADAELSARYPGASFKVSSFARRIVDYITLEEAPDASPMLPLPIFAGGPFRYVNSEATFYGGETSAAIALGASFTASLNASYLWGRNLATDEPALGVSPLRGSAGLRFEPRSGEGVPSESFPGHGFLRDSFLSDRFYAEGTLRAATEQSRVATLLGESPTGGYVTVDFKTGIEVGGGVALEGGVSNLTDVDYVNHLNASNPYTGAALPEPGRVFFLNARYEF